MKKHFNKKLIMTKEDDGDFENSTKCWICVNGYVHCDVKVRHQEAVVRRCSVEKVSQNFAKFTGKLN